MNEIEELQALADKCREQASERAQEHRRNPALVAEMRELMRTADKIAAIAKRLKAKQL